VQNGTIYVLTTLTDILPTRTATYSPTAKNIGLRYLRRNQTGDGGGAPLGVRLNNGMLNENGEYESPAVSPARSGVHAESHPFTGG